MQDFYEKKHNEYFASTISIEPDVFLEPLIDLLAPGETILDIGCGSGRDMLWLKKKGYTPSGFEKSIPLAKLAQKHSGCHVVVGDFTNYDFSSFNFDALLLIGALVHIPSSQLSTVLFRVCKALKDPGYILLSMKEGIGVSQQKDERTFTLWQAKHLESIFLDLGLVILDFTRNKSALKTGEIWLNYLLRKEKIG